MVSKTVTEKFLNSVVVTLIARATLVLAPFVFAFISYTTLQLYHGFVSAQETQAAQIADIQRILQDHQFRLESGKSARLDFQQNASQQFTKISEHLDQIGDKVAAINETVIRVQTIVETRLPSKEGRLNKSIIPE